jgi:hypothetical protein
MSAPFGYPVPPAGKRKMDGGIITYSGGRFYPLAPKAEDVNPIDIAHALSNQCRYTGHTKFFYPVSTHCVLMHDWLFEQGESRENCFCILMHDSSEAYLVDLAAPLKHHADGFGARFLEVEEAIDRVIAERFDLPYPMPPEVKAIDLQIRSTEMEQLLPPVVREDWGESLPITIPEWSPVEAKAQMLWRMQDYGIVERDPTGTWIPTIKETVLV